ncbi:hypothetical protein F5Y16DRAFT_150188 [Xylariaceae sp. FL0255]|nr:hypothetical protein F5Y16DRAFT_150188 [Xylariaceae sp. FL0255]
MCLIRGLFASQVCAGANAHAHQGVNIKIMGNLIQNSVEHLCPSNSVHWRNAFNGNLRGACIADREHTHQRISFFTTMPLIIIILLH